MLKEFSLTNSHPTETMASANFFQPIISLRISVVYPTSSPLSECVSKIDQTACNPPTVFSRSAFIIAAIRTTFGLVERSTFILIQWLMIRVSP